MSLLNETIKYNKNAKFKKKIKNKNTDNKDKKDQFTTNIIIMDSDKN